MHTTKRFLLLTSCAWCIAVAQAAQADYFGLEVIARDDIEICKDASEPEIPFKLDVCEVHVVFDDPADRLISVAFTNVSTTATQGFFQHTLGGNKAPGCALVSLYPTLECDSFITMGVECDAGASTTDPDFDSTKFNNDGEVSGGWYNSAPSNGQGDPDAKGRVMIARFSYKQNKNTSGDVCVFTQLAGSQDIIAFLLQPFDCSVPGGGLPSGGGGGGGAGGTICYVDDDKDPANTCLGGWADACPDLQTALALASMGSCSEIWVAEGTYLPSDCTPPCTTTDREDTFQLINGTAVYGGFPNGGGDGTFGARNPEMFSSELSGDLDGDDDQVMDFPDGPSYQDNSYHVVTGSGTDNTALLDGFTITAGNANVDPGVLDCSTSLGNSAGGGMLISAGTPAVSHCKFTFNSAFGFGGGLQIVGTNPLQEQPTVSQCTFTDNSSTNGAGGGLYVGGSHPEVTDCTFSNNQALQKGGGGMCNNCGSDSTVTNCTFDDNIANYGGGMANNNGSSPTVINCIFSNNTTSEINRNDSFGAGMAIAQNSRPTITNCTFIGNFTETGSAGGGIYIDNGSATVEDCTFTDNKSLASTGGGMCINEASSPVTITDSVFTGNGQLLAGYGGGISTDASEVIITGCTFSNLRSNTAGAIWDEVLGIVTITNCLFTGNSTNASSGRGGAIWQVSSSGVLTVTNCVFSGNSSHTDGGAIYTKTDSTTLTNCTFNDNSAVGDGGGVFIEEDPFVGVATLSNCIFWGNSDTGGEDESAQIFFVGMDPPSVTFTDIMELDEAGGSFCPTLCGDPGAEFCCNGNIGDDPKFIDADGPDNQAGTEDDNLRLTAVIGGSPGSPCIDAASNLEVPPDVADLDDDDDESERTPLDLDLNTRFVEDPLTLDTGVQDLPAYPDVVDMGAYEFNCPAQSGTCPWDLDDDNEVGPFDLAVLLGNWGLNPTHPADFNCDTVVGAFDLADLLGHWGNCPPP